jgi:hypothetical protein
LSDKDFKVKNKLVIAGLSNANGVLLVENHAVDSHTNLATQYGGTGTTTSPTSGQIPYSTSGTTYTPTALNTLDVKGSSYSADAPSSPVVGQIWVESDSTADSFDPNIIRRQSFTATAGQTEFTTSVSFIEGYEQVFFNGLLLLRTTDYTTSGGNTVTLGVAAALNDIVEVVTVTNLNSVNTYTQGEIDTAFVSQSNYFVAGKNKIINGDFAINQRGFSSTTFSTATFNSYGFDRFSTNNNGDGTTTASLQTFTPGTAPVAGYEGEFFFRIAKGAGGTFATNYQRIEDVRTFAGQTATLSFWAKSDVAQTFEPFIIQNFGSGGSTAVNTATSTVNVTTSWARYSVTVAIPSVSGKTIGTSSYLQVYVARFFSTSARTVDIWGVQFEAGSVATAFQTATGTLQGELAACQRYFQTMGAYQQMGSFYLNTAAMFTTSLPVVMRTTPTVTFNTTFTNAVDVPGVSTKTPTGYSSWGITAVSFAFLATGMASTTVYSPAAYVGGNHQLSAEL